MNTKRHTLINRQPQPVNICSQPSFNNKSASAIMTERTTETKPRKITPISQPISVLPTDIARIYTHIHPILILALYYLCFPSLVADPVSTLKKALAPLAHLQITYCVVCLPPSKASSTPPTTVSATPKKKKVQFVKPAANPPASLGSRIIVSSLNTLWDSELMELTCRLACSSFAPAVTLPCYTASYGYLDPLRRPFDYALLAQSALRDTYFAARSAPFVLRAWSRCAYVEGNFSGMSAV